MHDFLIAFIGGLMLGLSVVGYLYVNGRIAGISGLIGQVLNSKTMFKTPAIWFLLGLVLTPFIYGLFVQPEIELNASPLMMIVAGLLVGFGTRLGSGCTSGHGVTGLARRSPRSLAATLTFMLVAMCVVWLVPEINPV